MLLLLYILSIILLHSQIYPSSVTSDLPLGVDLDLEARFYPPHPGLSPVFAQADWKQLLQYFHFAVVVEVAIQAGKMNIVLELRLKNICEQERSSNLN